jgi:hypothetical protein
MNIWVMQGIHEGEMFASTHLTEKGAALAALSDVLGFLGVEDEETALSVRNNHYTYSDTDGEQTEPFEWDLEKMKDMTRKELWKIFGDWSELTWDNSCGYQIDVNKTEIAA